MVSDVRRRANERASEIAAVVVTGVWLTALVTNQEWWLGAMIAGYILVVPLVELLFEDETDEETTDEPAPSEPTPDPDEDPLATLRERYARGELTEEQFNRKLERLLETETIEDAAQHRRRTDREPSRERE